MTKIIITVVVLVITLSATYYFFDAKRDDNIPDGSSVTFPIGTPSDNQDNENDTDEPGRPDDEPALPDLENETITIQAPAGGIYEVRNFIKNGDAIEDTYNRGNYHVGNTYPSADSPTPLPSYIITYSAESQFFNVVLYREPLSRSRNEAEVFLQKTLGIRSADLCMLDYMVSTPYTVSEIYTSRDLKFSMCPGAVSLP
jgi:hypothetical protein